MTINSILRALEKSYAHPFPTAFSYSMAVVRPLTPPPLIPQVYTNPDPSTSNPTHHVHKSHPPAISTAHIQAPFYSTAAHWDSLLSPLFVQFSPELMKPRPLPPPPL